MYIPRTYVVYVREHFTSASAGSRVQVIQPLRKKYRRLQTSYVIIANSKMFMQLKGVGAPIISPFRTLYLCTSL